ncbi:MAG: hypothetical protein ACK4GG_13485, partial [Sphingomonas sp.]
ARCLGPAWRVGPARCDDPATTLLIAAAQLANWNVLSRPAGTSGVIDLDAERARLTKAIAAAEKERDSLNVRLSNPAFAEKAKPEAVEKARADHAEKSAEAARLGAALGRLG